jgi:hypothetical protein
MMALLGTIIVVALLVALRLLMPPVPGLLGLWRAFGKRTMAVLCSLAVAGAVALIVLSRR